MVRLPHSHLRGNAVTQSGFRDWGNQIFSCKETLSGMQSLPNLFLKGRRRFPCSQNDSFHVWSQTLDRAKARQFGYAGEAVECQVRKQDAWTESPKLVRSLFC